jgi:long-chain acyl-CoA synthetase
VMITAETRRARSPDGTSRWMSRTATEDDGAVSAFSAGPSPSSPQSSIPYRRQRGASMRNPIMLVHGFLEDSARRTPESRAAWYNGRWMNYGEIESLSNKAANRLLENGIRRGDRIALLHENSFDYIIHYYAILKAGAVTVALNTAFTADMLAYALNDSGAKCVISNQRFSKDLLPALRLSPGVEWVVQNQNDLSEFEDSGRRRAWRFSEVYENGNPEKPDAGGIDADIASIVYTSGSTGKPKGVTLTHLNIVSNTRSIVEYLKLTADDRVMAVLPFYYIYGKSLLNTHFCAGGSVVIDNRFAYPAVILDTMKETQVTGFAGVPSTFMILLGKTNVREFRFDRLRYVTQAGGAMAVPVQKEAAKVFSPAALVVMYGATEASARLSYLDPDHLPRKWGSIGKAIPNVRLSVVDETGEELPPGETGEIAAKGSNIMAGYWNDPEETAKVLKNGWYFTGDLGKKDEEGFLYVVGRKKDMIKAGGERVSAKEVEERILEIPEVHEVAAIGVPDELLGEAIKVFIVPGGEARLTEREYEVEIRKRLPSFMHPKTIVIVRELPRNESGKILKNQLK